MSNSLDLQASRQALENWITGTHFEDWDPYDALNSPLLSAISKRSQWAGILFTQIFRFLPVNIRPLFRIPKARMTKTVALIIQAYLNLAQCVDDPQKYLDQARTGLDWLIDQQIPGFHGACWGYSHDWRSRSLFLPKTQPSLVCTAFVSRTFLQAYEQLGDKSYLEIARSSCDFLLSDIPRYSQDDSFCFSYIPDKLVLVHNANMLGAELLGRVFSHSGENVLYENALKAMNFTLRGQKSDGSWNYDVYSEHSINRDWVDNFHSGFVIESLLRFIKYTGFNCGRSLENGLRYYVEDFFAPNGRPKRSSNSEYPVDLRDCAQAIILSSLIGEDNKYHAKLSMTLNWTLEKMRLRSWLFTYQMWPRYMNPLPYLRFQAWMFYALSFVLISQKSYSEAGKR